MAFPLHVPRLNNNDDTVRLNSFLVEVGAKLRKGDPIADIETDKATFTVEAEEDGYILALEGEPGYTLNVGATLAWMGTDASEQVPQTAGSIHSSEVQRLAAEPTLKALILLNQLGLDAAKIHASGPRLTVQDVENYARSNGLKRSPERSLEAAREPQPV